uniref:ABC transporter related n=1 Tax=Nitratidesulfovibrio vulgaris (strain DSM 19637 / Miyazaki F) TaxID=883 RepID=B8DMP9_NITV9
MTTDHTAHTGSAPAIIEACDLCKSYPATDGGAPAPVLRGVSLRVSPGEFVAVAGRSGSGKSTLLNVLASLTLPDSGTVLFDGQDITRVSEARRNRLRHSDFAVIFQAHHLMPYLTALENVLLPFMNGLAPVPAAMAEKGRSVLDRVGLSGKAASLPGALSGGEQQRVAIARALVRDARVLFADEPTGSLDTTTGEAIMELLAELGRDGLTTVMVTHNPDYARRAHRTLIMRDGLMVDGLA